MKRTNSNRYQGSPKSSTKPYERKINLNQITPKKFFTETNINNLEGDNLDIPQISDKNIQNQKGEDNIKNYNFNEEFKKNQTEISDSIQNNFEYSSHDNNLKTGEFGFSKNFQNRYYSDNNNENENYSSQNNNDIRYIKKDYQVKYIEGDNRDKNNREYPKYNFKYKYKKMQKDERNIEYDRPNEEDLNSEKEKIDLQELKKKPGRLLHQSVMETLDDEGNRVITKKTIKEFSQTTEGFRTKNIHQSKERKEYQRHTTNNIIYPKLKNKDRKTNLSFKNKNNNKGDRIYLLAQLAKIKNDSEKKKKKQFYSSSISPIIIHDSNGCENQNSIWSHEMIDPNSFDRETYERSNFNYNYPTNYARIELNNEPDYDDRCYYPSGPNKHYNMNQIQDDDYFIEHGSRNYRRDITSPIGYIATYSSGSEDNEEIGGSYDPYRNRINYNNYISINSKNNKSKSIPKYNNEGELIKKTEVTYEMEVQNDDLNNIQRQNLSGLEIKAHMDTSKDDKKDFQSPDRAFEDGYDKFRNVTMAMISSYGPTCEDRKVTRKMRNEIGGVVDLRQEINPINNYKIKKVKRFGYNIHKVVNPKSKIEGARIIQYWWRMLKERKNIKIKILKIIKIQSIYRGFLIRNQLIKSANLYNGIEIIKNLFYNHYKDTIQQLFKDITRNKIKSKLERLINKIEDKNINRKLIKYFFKYKFIVNLLGKQKQIGEEKKEIEITEEMYINYIKEKYLKVNKSEHIDELAIKELEKKKDSNEKEIGIISNKEGNENADINYIYNKKEFKDSGTYPIENELVMSKNNFEIKQSPINKVEINNNIKYEKMKNDDFNIIIERQELKIDKKEDYNILKTKKECKDEEIQKKPDIKEQGINPIKMENKIIKNDSIKLIYKKKETAEKGISSNISEKVSPRKICKNEKITYINKIIKLDKGQQIDPFKNLIKKNESINIISKKTRKKYYNAIKRSESFKIMSRKKKYQDAEIQYIPGKNIIQNQTLEIKRIRPETKDNFCQYISTNSTVCRVNSYSILRNQKEKIEYTIRKNNFSIIKKKKITNEKGEQCEFIQKNKTKEILIGNNKQRNKIKRLYEILENVWINKQFNKFIKKCKSKIKEEVIKKELMRIALLKWRFVKGYGGDRYGNIYDRNGKIIGEKEGQIKDISIQNTIDEDINAISLKNKTLLNRISKQMPIYIKSNDILNKKEMIDSGTGEGVNHILNQKIAKTVSLAYKGKQKGINKISGKNYFKITKEKKIYKNQGTTMQPTFNRIVKENQISINNDRFIYIQKRRRDLLRLIISKRIIRDKYKLNNYFLNWYKKTKRILEQERKRKLSFDKTRIIKNDKFQIINKKNEKEKSYEKVYVRNKVVKGVKIEYRQRKIKKDEAILTSFPPEFKKDNLKKEKLSNVIYKPKINPIILRKTQNESTTILGSAKKLFNKEIIEQAIKRKKEILIKYIESQITPESLLRKYIIMWRRKAQYKTLLNNAKIISTFCKSKLNHIKAKQSWRLLYNKYLFDKRQNNIMRILRKIKLRKNKILQLIRITTLIKFYNQRAFLHKIIMYWFIYSINVAKKRTQMKMLYENMLTTYVSMADDIFGKNQKNNPSIQDFMFEIVDTNKYQVKPLEDVPIAKSYYSKKKEEKKIITNIKYIHKDIEEEKEATIYKESNKYHYPRKNRDNMILRERINKIDGKKGNLSKEINLSFNYNDSSLFEDKNTKKNLKINYNFTPSIKNYGYRYYSQTNNAKGNNNYSLNNSSMSNNNYKTNDYSYKYKKDNSDYKIYNNNETKISFNKLNLNNNIYSNDQNVVKNNVLYKGIYGQNRSYINKNNNNYNTNKDFDYNKYRNNNIQTNYNNNYRNYNQNYNERIKTSYEDSNKNNMNYYNKIKPEEKSKYISNYYTRKMNDYNNNEKK